MEWSISPSLQRKPDTRSYILGTSYMDRLSMGFNNVFADSETEAAAGNVDAATLFRAVETFKDTDHIFFTDTDAVITDFDKDMFVVGLVHAGRNVAVLFAVFD